MRETINPDSDPFGQYSKFLLGYGSDIEILEPAELRNMMRKHVEDAHELYECICLGRGPTRCYPSRCWFSSVGSWLRLDAKHLEPTRRAANLVFGFVKNFLSYRSSPPTEPIIRDDSFARDNELDALITGDQERSSQAFIENALAARLDLSDPVESTYQGALWAFPDADVFWKDALCTNGTVKRVSGYEKFGYLEVLHYQGEIAHYADEIY